MEYNKKTLDFYFKWTVTINILPFFVIISPFFIDKSSKDFYPVLILSIVIAILFIPGIKYFLHFLSSKPVLTFSTETLCDYRSMVIVSWSDIDDLKIVFRRGQFISIKLKDANKYILKINNPILRLYYKIHSKISHGTFLIDLNYLKGNYETIFSTMNEYWTEFKKNESNK
jgi:hypothetical protein